MIIEKPDALAAFVTALSNLKAAAAIEGLEVRVNIHERRGPLVCWDREPARGFASWNSDDGKMWFVELMRLGRKRAATLAEAVEFVRAHMRGEDV